MKRREQGGLTHRLGQHLRESFEAARVAVGAGPEGREQDQFGVLEGGVGSKRADPWGGGDFWRGMVDEHDIHGLLG